MVAARERGLFELSDYSMDSIAVGINAFARNDALWAFLIAYGGAIVAGNIAAFVTFWVGFLANLESWRMMVFFGFIAAGEVTGDCFYFTLGHLLRGTKFGAWVERRVPGHGKVEHAIQGKSRRLLYLSKFAYGSGGMVVFSLGWTGSMPFRKFVKNSILSIIVALPVVFMIAYGLFSGLSPLAGIDEFKHIERLLLLGIIAFFVLEWALSKVVRAVVGNGE